MPNSEFTHQACLCQAQRTFSLCRRLPAVAEFFSVRFTLDLYEVPHTAGATYLVACLPWQIPDCGRQLMHVGIGREKCRAKTVLDVDCGTLAEVLFLRLVRQGDAEELVGPHLKVPPFRKRLSRQGFASAHFDRGVQDATADFNYAARRAPPISG